MGNQIRQIFKTIRQALPRLTEPTARELESGDRPLADSEQKLIEETIKSEESRYRAIAESIIPAAMFTTGAILTGFAELIGTWAFLGYLLLAVSPIVYWLQRVERRLKEAVDALKKRNARRY